MNLRKLHEVELTVTTVHRYSTIARTPEEAETIAEGMFMDGDTGEILNSTIDSSDAVPVGEETIEDDGTEGQ